MNHTSKDYRAIKEAEKPSETFPYIPMPVEANDRIWELAVIKQHTPAEAAEWERLTS